MRTSNEQKISELRSILQEIVDRSTYVADYDIDVMIREDGEMLVNIVLANEDGVVIREFEDTYFQVFCWAKLVLYPLLD